MKDIKNYEGLYAVTEDGQIWSYRSKKFLKLGAKENRYREVCLSKNGQGTNYLVHRLVAETLIPNPNNWPQVNHKDEDKTNNHVTNLEWCTAQYNTLYGTSIQRANEKRNKRVYCVELDREFNSAKSAAIALKINHSHLCECCRGGRHTAGGYHWRYANEYILE